jgi:hypothetical protein
MSNSYSDLVRRASTLGTGHVEKVLDGGGPLGVGRAPLVFAPRWASVDAWHCVESSGSRGSLARAILVREVAYIELE